MLKLSKYLRPECILIGLEAEDKWEAIGKLVSLLGDNGLVSDVERVKADVIERERKMTTGMEHGLAIPHAKSAGAAGLVVALGISREGIEFDSLDGEPARIIFLVVSSKDTTGPHIQCLAEIASLCSSEETRRALTEAETPEQVLEILRLETSKKR